MTKIYLTVIVAAAVIILLIYFFKKKSMVSDKQTAFATTIGQDKERLKSLGLYNTSQDAIGILDTAKLSYTKNINLFDKAEYKSDTSRQWIISLITANGGNFKKDDLWQMFDKTWRTNYEFAEIYGYSPKENGWTFVIAGDSPEEYSKLEVAVNLLGVYNDEHPVYNTEKLEKYAIELAHRLKKYPVAVNAQQTEAVAHAVERAKKLVALYNEFNKEAIIVLKGGKAYDGRAVWDVLQGVGLTWGDGDLFHWQNSSRGYGDEQYFSVWTTTNPGYFLPENIKSGEMNPTDLVFGFNIPRSADPVNIFEAMLNAIKYCQQKLGGTIVNADGKPFDEQEERKNITEIVIALKARGMTPGSLNTLQMY